MYLVRHGETEWNAKRLIQGHSDIPLNRRGKEQVRRLAARLKQSPISQICSSDLQRAYDTAQAVADMLGLFVCRHVELRERNYGDWEGKDYRMIQSQFPDFNPWMDTESKYNVETFSAMQQRGMCCLQEILRESEAEHILVVSHGGLINALLHHISGGVHGTGKTKLVNTGISYVRYEKGNWTVHTVNDGTHLADQ
ncbi:histidine phosphatase family protein [Aneurinibacillus thermoaerophilus]|uniref:histidine phosphatase family protein n=1 Tax=Aneurinibacillus thermoaerophilus TaxID=143495 RepID=UPI00214F6BB8|nr:MULTISPECIES: histidine phosphatase family protein [Aneurinibacillus]MED0676653.1 histidine phosphatase family protein [Aneurinibacillus thermoaerophilus]MED0679360.1 histidine phosphatase family protein [Aneurinibacillus thermoaerophilus]MED0738069.1 histidine phosphatase family protein [Aneurinibacillus thermoaerophilus]MED0756490.1 histidine phosphatase family protein [Aneurinibacillus thermoaerophilus]MED0761111.1 histidine phosphatase family protein [Aneurinibacillus thermoaerophilus]